MLTPKQETFVQGIIQGLSQADAYRAAYNCKNMTDNSVYVNASKLMSDTKIAQRIKGLRAELSKDSIMTAQERLEWLTGIVQDDVTNIDGKLRALDIMNKMTGEYVTKIDGNVSITRLEDLI